MMDHDFGKRWREYTEDHRQAVSPRHALLHELEAARQQCDDLVAERDAARADRDKALEERNDAINAVSYWEARAAKMREARDGLLHECGKCYPHWEYVVQQRDEAIRERDEAVKERNNAVDRRLSEVRRCIARISELEGEAQAMIKAHAAELEDCVKELDGVIAERDSLNQENAWLRRGLDSKKEGNG